MKYKKYSYLIALILMLLVGINNVYAETSKQCFYVSAKNDLRVRIVLQNYGNDSAPWLILGNEYAYSYVNKLGVEPLNELATIQNAFKPIMQYDKGIKNPSHESVTFNNFYGSLKDIHISKNPSCPQYVVIKKIPPIISWLSGPTYETLITNDLKTAQKGAQYADATENVYAEYAVLQPNMTSDEFFSEFKNDNDDDEEQISKEEFCGSLFGDPNNAGNDATGESPSLAYIINQIMDVVRIVVPILIIVLGILDFGKAVIASKEDEMKKAQNTFIKRLLIGVAVFFVPLLVNVVMSLADIVWENTGYSHCEVSEHLK